MLRNKSVRSIFDKHVEFEENPETVSWILKEKIQESASLMDRRWTSSQSEITAITGSFQLGDYNISDVRKSLSVGKEHLTWAVKCSILLSNTIFGSSV